MEDLIGIILFIIFIVYRTMGDRRKGMERNRKTREKQLPGKKRVPKAEPAAEFFPPQETTVPVQSHLPFYEEGESMEGQGYMEDDKGESKEERTLDPAPQVLAEPAAAFLSPAEMRQAIIWSEVLQKPKALRGRR